MQSWWRVLRGVMPYRWMVVLSMICALGVGLSYASGVTVMYPVMKIFISAENMQGWANRVSAQSRLGVTIFDLDNTIKIAKETGLIVTDRDKGRISPELAKVDGDFSITEVTSGDKSVVLDSEQHWHDAVKLLAGAPPGASVTLKTQPRKAATSKPVEAIVTPLVTVPLRDPVFYAAWLVQAVNKLPNDQPMTALIAMVLFFIFLCIIGSVFRYYQQYLGMNVANRVIVDLRRRAYNRVVQLPTSYFAQKGTADAMSRLTQDTNTLTDGVSMAFGKAVQEPVKAAFAFGAALWMDWKLTLMIIVSVPILGLIIRKFSKHMRKASRRSLESWSTILAIINETLIGARVVKAYAAEGYERRRFARANRQLLKQQIKLNHYNALSRPFVETLAVILSAVPMLIAANLVLNGSVTSEQLLTLLALFGAMLEPMRKLADVNAKVQQTNAAAARVFELIDMPVEPNTSHDLPRLARHHRSVEFRDLIFSYPGHEEIVLNNINVTVMAGQNVAVVGGNGSGKTTLLQLLPRLYTPTKGQVLVDGVDTATVSLRSLRSQIGLVTQDTLLFEDTIYNNIAYGARHVTREQVMKASVRAFADEFIQRDLPQKYDTMVGQHGVRLSGGQKQRIALARAILRDPPILILDEAMSQVDAESETRITDALRSFTLNRTTFMIAHRFQSVVSADLIICLDHGQIAGVGNHGQLMEACLPYRKLYENQFREAG